MIYHLHDYEFERKMKQRLEKGREEVERRFSEFEAKERKRLNPKPPVMAIDELLAKYLTNYELPYSLHHPTSLQNLRTSNEQLGSLCDRARTHRLRRQKNSWKYGQGSHAPTKH